MPGGPRGGGALRHGSGWALLPVLVVSWHQGPKQGRQEGASRTLRPRGPWWEVSPSPLPRPDRTQPGPSHAKGPAAGLPEGVGNQRHTRRETRDMGLTVPTCPGAYTLPSTTLT